MEMQILLLLDYIVEAIAKMIQSMNLVAMSLLNQTMIQRMKCFGIM